MKKIIAVSAFTFLLILTFGFSPRILATSPADSPEEYIDFLEHKVTEENFQANSRNSKKVKSDIKAVLDGFKELSTEDQEKYLYYISSPEILDEAWNALANLEEGEVETLYNGDIKVSEEVVKSETVQPRSAFTKEHEATRTATLNVLDLNVAEVYAYMQWTSNGDTTEFCCNVASVNDSDSGIVQNLIPLQSLTGNPRAPYVSGNVGIFSVAWEIKYDYQGIGTGARTQVHEMTAIGTGDTTGRVYNL